MRLIYQEIALLRFLIGHGFKLLFSRNEATAAQWSKLTNTLVLTNGTVRVDNIQAVPPARYFIVSEPK